MERRTEKKASGFGAEFGRASFRELNSVEMRATSARNRSEGNSALPKPERNHDLAVGPSTICDRPTKRSRNEEPPMSEPEKTTDLLRQVRNGEELARNALLAHVRERQMKLASRLKRGYPLLRCMADTDDVIQALQIRLHEVLSSNAPTSASHFESLWKRMVKRTLYDFVRRFMGRNGKKARTLTNLESSIDEKKLLETLQAPGDDPMCLEFWTAFHECAATLPEKERDVFRLLHYQDMTQKQAASILGVSLKTVRRRWTRAKCLLGECLIDNVGEC
jgi:RNA polymerase sigma factor (sigma-70 family)